MSNITNILVVDDEMGIREGCKRALTKEGYQVDTAEDGSIGLHKVKDHPYDIILMDLMMPGIGGLELIQKVHDIDPAYDYLPKPFTPEALTAVVKRGLEKRALRLEAKRLHFERDQKLLELTNEQTRVKTIIGCMADGILVTNLEGQLVLWNSAAVKMLKMEGTDSSGKTLDHYLYVVRYY